MKQGPVSTGNSPFARWQTLPVEAVTTTDGFWSERQRVNRVESLLHGFQQLDRAGNFTNLRLVTGAAEGEYRTPVFMDSDVYKWLEAVGYELARADDADLRAMADVAIDLVEQAQGADGYINSYWDVVEPDRRWDDLAHGHELYCAGHLFQAAVAVHRAIGDARLLDVSRRFADYIDSVFGAGKRDGTPGHPEIEMALVELYRETGEKRYLDLAGYFVDQRGTNSLGEGRHGGLAYYQDHVAVRDSTTMEGHAVRQLYLTAGVADLYLETGEGALLESLLRQWHDMVAHKLFITGGLGSQHAGEAFGEPYELPNERCYCETCAQIAGIMWNWRMLLISGEGRYADLIERTLYNGFLSGVSLDGHRYFYVNPLQSRGADPWLGRKYVERQEWHGCACCPPNVMRLLSSLGHYVATGDAGGVQLHQYMPGSISFVGPSASTVKLGLTTDYPWQGDVGIAVEEADGSPWTLRLRIPGWCRSFTLQVNGQPVEPLLQDGYISLNRAWHQGDSVRLALHMAPTLMEAHPRVDPTRGSVAIERGPLVYCLEQIDQDPEVDVADVRIDVQAPLSENWRDDMLDGVMLVEASGTLQDTTAWSDMLYRPLGSGVDDASRQTTLTAVPYYAWANRGANAMRVWIAR